MMVKRKHAPDPEMAGEIGLAALVFLCSDRSRLGRFLDLTGLSPADLQQQAQLPSLQAAVLDHLLGDESLLLVFTSSSGIAPEHVAPARSILSGEA